MKPQLTSDSGNCRVSVMVGIRNDPGKPIDSITVQFQLPPLIVSADLTANYGTVDILADKVSVLPTISSTVTPLIPDLVTGQGKGSIVGSFRKFSEAEHSTSLHVPSPCYASLTLAFLCRPVCGQLGRYQKTKHRHSLEIYDWRKGSHNCMHCRHFRWNLGLWGLPYLAFKSISWTWRTPRTLRTKVSEPRLKLGSMRSDRRCLQVGSC